MGEGDSDPRKMPDGGRTMQLDAVVDELEEVAPPPDLGPSAAPPPLPPKKPSKAMYVIGALVVLLMAGLGIGVGVFLMGDDEPGGSPAAAAPEPNAPEASEPPAEETGPEDEAAEGEDVVQMDEVVFGE